MLQYNATAILHDNQHAFIATSYESKQLSSVDDDEIPELQDSSSDEESSAQLHTSDYTERIRAKVYDCQVTSVSALFHHAQHYEKPKNLSHNACEKHGTLSNDAELATDQSHERINYWSFHRWSHRAGFPVCWNTASQTELPSNTIFNVIDLTDHRREEAATLVAATTFRCLQRALAIFMLLLITFQVFHRNSLFSVVWHTQEEFTQTVIEQDDKMVQTDDHELKLRAAVRRSFISNALRSIVELCNHEGIARLKLMTHLEWIHRLGITTLEVLLPIERLARGTLRVSRHFHHILCLDSLAPMPTLLLEQEKLLRRQTQLRQDRARQNMSLGLSPKPTPSELDKQWLIQAFKHNQRTSLIFNMLWGQYCDGQSQRRDPAHHEAVHLLQFLREHGDLPEPAVLRYDTPWTCIIWTSPESEQRQPPDSPEKTHSKIQELMQADIIEAEDVLRTILITHADMLLAYISHSPDRFVCYSQQMGTGVQLMHFHALKFALFEKTIELAEASAAHRGAEPDKSNV